MQKYSYAMENTMILKLKDGDVVIELFKDIAPNHVERFQKLSKETHVVPQMMSQKCFRRIKIG